MISLLLSVAAAVAEPVPEAQRSGIPPMEVTLHREAAPILVEGQTLVLHLPIPAVPAGVRWEYVKTWIERTQGETDLVQDLTATGSPIPPKGEKTAVFRARAKGRSAVGMEARPAEGSALKRTLRIPVVIETPAEIRKVCETRTQALREKLGEFSLLIRYVGPAVEKDPYPSLALSVPALDAPKGCAIVSITAAAAARIIERLAENSLFGRLLETKGGSPWGYGAGPGDAPRTLALPAYEFEVRAGGAAYGETFLVGSGAAALVGALREALDGDAARILDAVSARMGVQGASRSRQVDTKNAGVYVAGPWRYEYEIRSIGTKSECRAGVLSYGGKVLDAAFAKPLDRIETPWGMMQFHRHHYDEGWLLSLTHDRPIEKGKGRLLKPPKR